MASLTPSTESPACAALITRERAVTASNYLPLTVVLTGGRGERLTDIDGRRYLDLMSAYSAASHGHAHPRLVRALVAQAQQLAVTSRAFHTTPLAALLERLARLTGLAQNLPASGGAESVETAIKAARRWGYRVKGIPEGQAEIAVARGNFHGRSTTIVGFSTEAGYRDGFGPFARGFRHFDFGDLASVAAALTPHTAAVLIEPIQGEAGIVVPPAGFLRALRELCTAQRVLLIVDEVQSGLGRTGRWFACQHEGVQPDGMILGQALGGGLLPISCFMATRELMQVFEPGSHGSTFGGNLLAAAVALEALQVIDDEQLVARSAALGAHLIERLHAIESPLVRAVRGRGLWVGVDLDPRRVSARRADQGHARDRDPLCAAARYHARCARLGDRHLHRDAARVRPDQRHPTPPAHRPRAGRACLHRRPTLTEECVDACPPQLVAVVYPAVARPIDPCARSAGARASDDERARSLRGQLRHQPVDGPDRLERFGRAPAP